MKGLIFKKNDEVDISSDYQWPFIEILERYLVTIYVTPVVRGKKEKRGEIFEYGLVVKGYDKKGKCVIVTHINENEFMAEVTQNIYVLVDSITIEKKESKNVKNK